tara:strand:+ start:409 stop:615 length:207 start_codon:yes stop_codon:yes gene_type:complete
MDVIDCFYGQDLLDVLALIYQDHAYINSGTQLDLCVRAADYARDKPKGPSGINPDDPLPEEDVSTFEE